MTHAQRTPKVATSVTELGAVENAARSAERRRWFREGRCPSCGELGDFVAGAPVCSVHGPYEFVKEPTPTDPHFDEAEALPDD